MDTQDEALERYSSLDPPPSSFATHLSRGHSLSVWRTLLPINSSKPISSGHSRSLSPNQPQQRESIPPLSQALFYPNVPNSKKNGWRVKSVFEEIPTTVTHPEGRLHPHPPQTLKITNPMMTMDKGLQPRDNTWPRHDRAGPFSSPNLNSWLMLSTDPPNLVLARIQPQTSHRCFGGAR